LVLRHDGAIAQFGFAAAYLRSVCARLPSALVQPFEELAMKPHQPDADDKAADITSRPLQPDVPGDDDRPLPDEHPKTEEPLRELEPRSIERQFGETPDLAAGTDQAEGVRDWYQHSPGMKESFPDESKPDSKPERPLPR
jgi:hypothetical protein